MSDLVERLRNHELRNSAMDEAADRIEALEAERERLWCTACGTVTRDKICDCNRWHNEMSREPHFVNYADERASGIEALEAALRKITDLIDSEADDPLNDAIEIARAALAPEQDHGDII